MNDRLKLRGREVFEEAIELSAESRPAFLAAACEGDSDLRRHVDALLAALERAGTFLGGPTVEPGFSPDQGATADGTPPGTPPPSQPPMPWPGERPGTRIGRYELLEPIGEGGFGSVFAAEQRHPVRRKVALKVIKPGMDTRQVIARFEAERQALAMMDHPHIAKVFDAGATDGGPALFRDGAGAGRSRHPVLRRESFDPAGAAGGLSPGLPGHPPRAPEGGHPPRPQALQHPGRCGWTASRSSR